MHPLGAWIEIYRQDVDLQKSRPALKGSDQSALASTSRADHEDDWRGGSVLIAHDSCPPEG